MHNQFTTSIDQLREKSSRIIDALLRRQLYPESTGWIDYPDNCSELVQKIDSIAENIISSSSRLLVIGTGGSYLGASAIISALGHQSITKVLFVGYSLNPSVIDSIINELKNEDFCINIVSKSGSTLEIKVLASIFVNLLKSKYPDNYQDRIIVTTEDDSPLHKIAIDKGYCTLPIPKNIGGRYSVITAAGLLPIRVAGLDIVSFLEGASDVRHELSNQGSNAYISIQRYIEHKAICSGTNKVVDLLVTNNERMLKFLEWVQQLAAESLGKQGVGSFPSVLLYPRDLHSVGQFVQEGNPIVSETFINILESGADTQIEESEFFNGMDSCTTIDQLNKIIANSAIESHYHAGVPIYVTSIDQLDEHNLGVLVYLFEMSIACLGIMMSINPFDQPGVESYKSIIRSKYPER